MKQILFSSILCGFLALALLVFAPSSAHADCSATGDLPAGPQGALEYSAANGAHYTCDNTDTWVQAGGGGSGSGSGSGGGSPCSSETANWSNCTASIPAAPDGASSTASDTSGGGFNCNGGWTGYIGSKSFSCINGTFVANAGSDTCNAHGGCSGGCSCGTPCGGSCPDDDDDDTDESRGDLPWEKWSKEKFMDTISEMKAKGALH